MKINYCIEENFKDYFDLAIQYWMYAKSHGKEIEYKKSILFLGFSTELTVLMLVRNKANKPIYTKKGFTINFSTACRELLKHPDIYKYIDEDFFLELDENDQLAGQSSLERIKNLRNKLIHSEGAFETGTLDSEIIETVMVLHYLLLALEKNIICEVKHSNWLIQQILEYQYWEDISTKLKNLLIINKDNYSDIPELYSSFCPNCGSYQSLRVQEKNERIDLICWICLQEAKLYECYICGTGVIENEAHILNQNDPDYIMCDCCWERKF